MRRHRVFFDRLGAIIVAVVTAIVGPIIITLVASGRPSAEVLVAFVIFVVFTVTVAAWQSRRRNSHRTEARKGRQSFPQLRNKAIKEIQGYLDPRLNQSLSRVRLRLEADSAAVAPPQDISVGLPLGATPAWPRNAGIEKVFAELSESMVILGMPGSGKTTMLLDLARSLLDTARHDAKRPLPVVIELTTWGRRKRTLLRRKVERKRTLLRRKVESLYEDPMEWLLGQLHETYKIGAEVARSWLANRKLALLFDGLDEMPQADRERCVDWLNAMQETWRVPPMVVCCRTNEYERLTKLRLQGAVTIHPLTRKMVAKWLDRSPLAGLRTALAADETLWELLDAPLWLDVMTRVFEDGSPAESLTGESAKERRTKLLEAYITGELQRRKMPSRYKDGETFRWLSQLADMIRGSDEATIRRRRLRWDLQGLRLPLAGDAAVANRLLPSTLACLAAGFVFWIAVHFGLSFGIIVAGVCIVGVFFTAAATLVPSPPPSVSFQKFRMAAPLGAAMGLLAGGIGVVLALLIATGIEMLVAKIELIPHSHMTYVVEARLFAVLEFSYILGLIFSWAWVWKKLRMPDKVRELMLLIWVLASAVLMLIIGVLALITYKGKATAVTPFCIGFMLGLFSSLAVWAVTLLTSHTGDFQWRRLWKTAMFSPFPFAGALAAASVIGFQSTHSWLMPFALAVGTVGGGFAGLLLDDGWLDYYLSESIVRPLYSWAGLLPWRLGPFLEYAVGKNLLYREDRGYRFLHLLFVEYFARKNSIGEPSKLEEPIRQPGPDQP